MKNLLESVKSFAKKALVGEKWGFCIRDGKVGAFPPDEKPEYGCIVVMDGDLGFIPRGTKELERGQWELFERLELEIAGKDATTYMLERELPLPVIAKVTDVEAKTLRIACGDGNSGYLEVQTGQINWDE